MQLHLIRHAHAEDTRPDPLRRLSKRGCRQVRTLARFLRRSEALAPKEIWHSTLVRARETAELLAERTRLKVPLREIAGLAPEDNPARFARQLATCEKTVAVVGHEPFLSALASLLVAGAPAPVRFAMKKGAVLTLERERRHWTVRWHVSPDLLG